jgi:urease accessory protein
VNRACAATALLFMALPAAHAHSPVKGIGIFYSGALHPLTTPAHLLALLAFGLLLGQQAQRRRSELQALKAPLLALLAAFAAGIAQAGLQAAEGPDTDRLLLVLAAAAGLAAAAARRVSPFLLVLGALACGLAVAVASAPSGVAAGARWASLAGTGAAALLLAAYIAVSVSAAQRAWLQIAVRVVGAWFASAALLVLALSLAPGRAG